MKILIGVDDSPCSNAALEFVRQLAMPAGTRVIVVSAVLPPVVAYSEIYVPAAGAAGTLLQDETKAHQELVSRAELELREAGFLTEARVLQGDPREAIVRTAEAEKVDLV